MNLSKNVRPFCILALLCGLYFLVVLVCMHIIRTDLNPYETPISYYRAGPNSYILSSAFVAGSVAEMIIVALLGLISKSDKINISRLGRATLFLAAIFLFITGLVKLGTVHWLGALLHTLLFPFAVILIGYSIKDGITKRVSIILSVMTTIILFTLSEAFTDNGIFHPYFGLLEKVDIVLMMVWCTIIVTAIYQASLISTFAADEEPRISTRRG